MPGRSFIFRTFVVCALGVVIYGRLVRMAAPPAVDRPTPVPPFLQSVTPYFERISIYGSPEEFAEQFRAAPEPVQHMFAATWCRTEVCNGGFHQFYSNSTGVLAPEAVQGFRAIGMPKLADVVQRANVWFGADFPRDHQLRNKLLDQYGRRDPAVEYDYFQFFELDKEFFSLLETEFGGFEANADLYARKHGVK